MDAVEAVGSPGRGVNTAGDGISGTGWDDGAGNGGHGKMQIGGGPELTRAALSTGGRCKKRFPERQGEVWLLRGWKSLKFGAKSPRV